METNTQNTVKNSTTNDFRKDTRPKRDDRGNKKTRNPVEKPKSEFEQKIISIRRVTRVVAGGRRFSFSVALAIGNHQGKVGVGQGKAGDTSLAIQKAYNEAKKNLIAVKMEESRSIPYDTLAKYNSATVYLMPNKFKGIVAGSSVRTVLNLAGLKDVSGKVRSKSKNQVNNAKATIEALSIFSVPLSPKERMSDEAEVKAELPAAVADKANKNKKQQEII